MCAEMKVDIIQRESIKPFSPTPEHLRNYKLSLNDQVTPDVDIPLILFYPISNTLSTEINLVSDQKSNNLKTSLSQTLSHYYPFAGRLKNNYWVDCNDNGVDYIQVKINCPISKLLENPDPDLLKLLLPNSIKPKETLTDSHSLLLVQVNFFECGGLAIGLSISHKIADASSFCKFIKNWAATCSASGDFVLPIFDGASNNPPVDFFSLNPPASEFDNDQEKCTIKRYVFDASKIATLKLKAASTTVPNPTRVEAVSALIWKCAMEASISISGCIKPSVFCQLVNTRKRNVPCLPENIVGNFVSVFTSKTEELNEIDLKELVGKLRRGMEQVCENSKSNKPRHGWEVIEQGLVEFRKMIKSKDIDSYKCSSWCRFPIYEVNFGWGKPKWVSIAYVTINNVIQLIDTKDGGGIEAWLVFSEQDMALIESNKEMQTFSCLNPSIV